MLEISSGLRGLNDMDTKNLGFGSRADACRPIDGETFGETGDYYGQELRRPGAPTSRGSALSVHRNFLAVDGNEIHVFVLSR